MLIDIHGHLWMGMYEENKKDIIKACKLYNISKIYISSLGTLYPDKFEIDELNNATHQFMKESPELVEGFCYINPNNENCMEELKKGIEEYKMSGMKLWVATFCDDPKVYPLIEKCIDYKIPVLIHAFHKAVGQLEHESLGINVSNLAEKYPEAKIIMAHLGANCYLGVKAIKNRGNVFVDMSGSIFRRDDIDYTKKLIGAERIIFGSDMPDVNVVTTLGQVEEADLTEKEKNMIYYENALKILRRK